ncbi:amidohydrolase family protein [Flavobacteriaceae bacterium]|nr:amidohydrolase family protein [Flavobacteriaceae bacterium]MDA9250527.1 amidohydrolase family protein [Flavobacteriaceae bacterium]
MIIDAHQHLWKYDPVRDHWIEDSMEVLRKDFLPKDLKPILDANGVAGCIAVQADQSEEETEFLLKCAQENPFLKGVVGWVDLRAGNVEERLANYSHNEYFKGVRHIVQAEKDDFLLNKDFQNGVGKLSQYGLSYDLLIYPRQFPATLEMVEKFPNQIFVLDHIAKPSVSQKLDAEWVKNILLLSKHENVFCKISGMVTETKNFEWVKSDFTPYLASVVSAFGTDRLLYGSDWPVCLLAADYKEVLGIIVDYFQNFSTLEKSKIFALNAIKAYNLDCI